ncbi:hypothetical protein ADUPG1_014866 [Aduncisulcus paluster]|uniref:Uncharacterized protein n=2 Tax=Aduncisulcus paluster TaxID=2918883 RepID=A0ABQ5KBH9_9EUKA|nr:hypothetical protein ADUPG1_014866 [Aduncisulcus paluster]
MPHFPTYIWDLPDNKLCCMAVDDWGKYVAVGYCKPGVIQIIDIETKLIVRVYKPFDEAITSLAFSPDNQLLFVGCITGVMKVISLKCDLKELSWADLLQNEKYNNAGVIFCENIHDKNDKHAQSNEIKIDPSRTEKMLTKITIYPLLVPLTSQVSNMHSYCEFYCAITTITGCMLYKMGYELTPEINTLYKYQECTLLGRHPCVSFCHGGKTLIFSMGKLLYIYDLKEIPKIDCKSSKIHEERNYVYGNQNQSDLISMATSLTDVDTMNLEHVSRQTVKASFFFVLQSLTKSPLEFQSWITHVLCSSPLNSESSCCYVVCDDRSFHQKLIIRVDGKGVEREEKKKVVKEEEDDEGRERRGERRGEVQEEREKEKKGLKIESDTKDGDLKIDSVDKSEFQGQHRKDEEEAEDEEQRGSEEAEDMLQKQDISGSQEREMIDEAVSDTSHASISPIDTALASIDTTHISLSLFLSLTPFGMLLYSCGQTIALTDMTTGIDSARREDLKIDCIDMVCARAIGGGRVRKTHREGLGKKGTKLVSSSSSSSSSCSISIHPSIDMSRRGDSLASLSSPNVFFFTLHPNNLCMWQFNECDDYGALHCGYDTFPVNKALEEREDEADEVADELLYPVTGTQAPMLTPFSVEKYPELSLKIGSACFWESDSSKIDIAGKDIAGKEEEPGNLVVPHAKVYSEYPNIYDSIESVPWRYPTAGMGLTAAAVLCAREERKKRRLRLELELKRKDSLVTSGEQQPAAVAVESSAIDGRELMQESLGGIIVGVDDECDVGAGIDIDILGDSSQEEETPLIHAEKRRKEECIWCYPANQILDYDVMFEMDTLDPLNGPSIPLDFTSL